MEVTQFSNKFLNVLYSKSKNDFSKGYDYQSVAKILGLNKIETRTVINFLSEKELINTKSGYGNNLLLTAKGIELVEKQRSNKIFNTLRFKSTRHLPSSRDAIEFLYFYDIIDENGKAIPRTIKISISGSLSISWGFQIWSPEPEKTYKNLEKILLQFGKDKIIEKLKEDTLNDHEELILLTSTHPLEPPYNPSNLIDVAEAEYEVEVGHKTLSEEITENKLAASIIESRDRINAIFHSRHKAKLLLLNEERNLLDFFKTANSEEEFSHRIASLGQVSRHLNIDILRKLTGEDNLQEGSIFLLEKFLATINKKDKSITETLRQIGRIRQGYPIHTDITGAIKGYEYFGLKYPVDDYASTWMSLLNFYLTALKRLHETLYEEYLISDKQRAN